MPRHRFVLAILTISSLSACWVPQVVQGVRPEIFPSAPASVTPSAEVSTQSKQVALATRMVAVSRQVANSFHLSTELAQHRQRLENHLFYNVQQTGDFSRWFFSADRYTYYDSTQGARFELQFYKSGNDAPGFDVLGYGSYGAEPLPAKAFPSDVSRYQLSLNQQGTQFQDQLNVSLNGSWPTQIPLRDSFNTVLSGSGQVSDSAFYQDLSLQINGQTASAASSFEGQLAFSASIDGKVYNGFGRFDNLGFSNQVSLQQNGAEVAVIERQDKSWQIKIADQVVASVS